MIPKMPERVSPAERAARALPCRVWDDERLSWSKSPWTSCSKRGHVVACTALERPAVAREIAEAEEEVRERGCPKRTMKTHELKCWPPFWRDVVDGTKRFEIRKDDRSYDVGDVLVLNEFVRDPIGGRYTGASVRVRVVYLLSGGFGLESGYVALGIERCGP